MNEKRIAAAPLADAVERLAIDKDQRRVLLALADAEDWTPLSAITTLLGKTGARRVKTAVLSLIEERLIEAGTSDGADGFVRSLPLEQWTKDEHFTAGAGIRWGY